MRVILTGGLGNQLFKLMAAQKFLDRFPKSKIKLDISWYSDGNQNLRESHIFFQLGDLADNKQYFVTSTRFPRFYAYLIGKVRKFGSNTLDFLGIYSDNSNLTNLQRAPLVFFGNFESTKYLPEFKSAEKIFLRLDSGSSWKQELVADINQHDPIIVHVRLGDYLNFPDVYGFLDDKYFVDGVRHLRSKGASGPLWLTSDNPELAKERLSGKLKFDRVLVTPPNLPPLQLLLGIAAARNLVIAHSTFSWWAAWISSNRQGNSNIVMPSRFLAEETQTQRLQVSGWHVINV